VNAATESVWNEAQRRSAAGALAERRRITIDPVTRLEGHGKIDIYLDAAGNVERAYLQIPELRGFEVFSIGRPAEDMPQITR
jgi:F420-non-reducing hydrogenase large subunit